MRRLRCLNHQLTTTMALVMALFLASLSAPAFASIKSGSSCTLSQYNSDVRLKSGKTTYACTGAPNGYSWYPVGSGGSSAHVSNSKPVVVKPVTGNANFMLGYKMISGASIGVLQQWNFYAFLSPNGSLTLANATDWCSQIPRASPGVWNSIAGGYVGSLDWSKGCVVGVMKLAN